MGTLVTIHVVADGSDAAVDRAFAWFHRVEQVCTRFNPQSELMQLTSRIGEAVPVSALLFEAVQFAVKVAEESHGAFDPTVGREMEARGFNREYNTGRIAETAIDNDREVTYRDLRLDADRKTITLLRPLLLDLGGLAKGLAVDMAARELAEYRDFAIDAGGDLYLGGLNPAGEEWSVGIRHPRRDGELIESLRVSNQAVCTSGDYERPAHIVDPASRASAATVASASVIATTAMVADALATAAFVMGPDEGIDFLDRMGVDGFIVTPELNRYSTQGLFCAA